ncbi:cyclin dependent kinase-5 activator [Anaeramoeba flamelloides]|uniref:Cyclin dependent kinase-5 activator n=1 Tax=Anaeramoeba flamelloides TaxID=1746091 RepID=A0ABQ8YEP4_9EUKA|nr:cyclin dependent kinase-5 activator [Anaeramoeba flamelloides]
MFFLILGVSEFADSIKEVLASSTVILLITTILTTAKSYITKTFQLSETRPHSLAGSFTSIAYYLSATTFSLSIKYVGSRDVDVFMRSCFLFAALTMGLGPFLVLAPTEKTILKKETFFKKLTRGAQTKEARTGFLMIFIIITIMQGLVVFSLWHSLNDVLQLDLKVTVGVVVGYSLVCLFYLVIFYSVMMEKEVVIGGINLMDQLRRKLIFRKKDGTKVEILATKIYRNIYLTLFVTVALLSLAALIYTFIREIKSFMDLTTFGKVILLFFTLINVLGLVTYCGFILNVAFHPAKTNEVDLGGGVTVAENRIKYVAIGRSCDRTLLARFVAPDDPDSWSIEAVVKRDLKTSVTTPGYRRVRKCARYALFQENDYASMYFVGTGPQYPNNLAWFFVDKIQFKINDDYYEKGVNNYSSYPTDSLSKPLNKYLEDLAKEFSTEKEWNSLNKSQHLNCWEHGQLSERQMQIQRVCDIITDQKHLEKIIINNSQMETLILKEKEERHFEKIRKERQEREKEREQKRQLALRQQQEEIKILERESLLLEREKEKKKLEYQKKQKIQKQKIELKKREKKRKELLKKEKRKKKDSKKEEKKKAVIEKNIFFNQITEEKKFEKEQDIKLQEDLFGGFQATPTTTTWTSTSVSTRPSSGLKNIDQYAISNSSFIPQEEVFMGIPQKPRVETGKKSRHRTRRSAGRGKGRGRGVVIQKPTAFSHTTNIGMIPELSNLMLESHDIKFENEETEDVIASTQLDFEPEYDSGSESEMEPLSDLKEMVKEKEIKREKEKEKEKENYDDDDDVRLEEEEERKDLKILQGGLEKELLSQALLLDDLEMKSDQIQDSAKKLKKSLKGQKMSQDKKKRKKQRKKPMIKKKPKPKKKSMPEKKDMDKEKKEKKVDNSVGLQDLKQEISPIRNELNNTFYDDVNGIKMPLKTTQERRKEDISYKQTSILKEPEITNVYPELPNIVPTLQLDELIDDEIIIKSSKKKKKKKNIKRNQIEFEEFDNFGVSKEQEITLDTPKNSLFPDVVIDGEYDEEEEEEEEDGEFDDFLSLLSKETPPPPLPPSSSSSSSSSSYSSSGSIELPKIKQQSLDLTNEEERIKEINNRIELLTLEQQKGESSDLSFDASEDETILLYEQNKELEKKLNTKSNLRPLQYDLNFEIAEDTLTKNYVPCSNYSVNDLKSKDENLDKSIGCELNPPIISESFNENKKFENIKLINNYVDRHNINKNKGDDDDDDEQLNSSEQLLKNFPLEKYLKRELKKKERGELKLTKMEKYYNIRKDVLKNLIQRAKKVNQKSRKINEKQFGQEFKNRVKFNNYYNPIFDLTSGKGKYIEIKRGSKSDNDRSHNIIEFKVVQLPKKTNFLTIYSQNCLPRNGNIIWEIQLQRIVPKAGIRIGLTPKLSEIIKKQRKFENNKELLSHREKLDPGIELGELPGSCAIDGLGQVFDFKNGISKFCSQFQSKDRITFFLNNDHKYLALARNGRYLGKIGFNLIEDLYFAVTFYSRSIKFNEIILDKRLNLLPSTESQFLLNPFGYNYINYYCKRDWILLNKLASFFKGNKSRITIYQSEGNFYFKNQILKSFSRFVGNVHVFVRKILIGNNFLSRDEQITVQDLLLIAKRRMRLFYIIAFGSINKDRNIQMFKLMKEVDFFLNLYASWIIAPNADTACLIIKENLTDRYDNSNEFPTGDEFHIRNFLIVWFDEIQQLLSRSYKSEFPRDIPAVSTIGPSQTISLLNFSSDDDLIKLPIDN